MNWPDDCVRLRYVISESSFFPSSPPSCTDRSYGDVNAERFPLPVSSTRMTSSLGHVTSSSNTVCAQLKCHDNDNKQKNTSIISTGDNCTSKFVESVCVDSFVEKDSTKLSTWILQCQQIQYLAVLQLLFFSDLFKIPLPYTRTDVYTLKSSLMCPNALENA